MVQFNFLMNNFRRMCLKCENCSLRGISDISDIQTTFRLYKIFIVKTANGNTLKMKMASPI